MAEIESERVDHALEWDEQTLWLWLSNNADSLDLDQHDIKRIKESEIRNGEQIASVDPSRLAMEWGPPIDVCEKIRDFIMTMAPPDKYRHQSQDSSGSSAVVIDAVESVDHPEDLAGSRPSKEGHRLHPLFGSISRNSLKQRVDFSLRDNNNMSMAIEGSGSPNVALMGPRCQLRLTIKNDLFMSRLCYPRWWIENGDCRRLPNAVSFGNELTVQLEGYPGESLQGLLSYVIYDLPYLPPSCFTSSVASLLMNSDPNQMSSVASMFPREVLPPPFGTIFPKCFVNMNIRREQEKDDDAKSASETVQTRIIIMWSVQLPKDAQQWAGRLATPRRMDSGGSTGHHHGHSRNISTLSDLSFESLENLNRFAVTFVEDTEDLSLNPELFQDIIEAKGAIAELEQSQTTNEIYEATATMGNGPVCDLCVNFQDIMVDTSTLLPDGQDLFGRTESEFQNAASSKMVKLEDVMSFLQPRTMFGGRGPTAFDMRTSSQRSSVSDRYATRERSRTHDGRASPPREFARVRSQGSALDPRDSAPRLRATDLQTPGDAFKTVSPMFSPRRYSQATRDEDFIQQGDRVLLENSRRGQVKVICQHEKWGYGTWYCVRLTEPRGNNDGSWKGVRAFHCPARYGVMVQKRSIVQKLVEARFNFMDEETQANSSEQAAQHRKLDSLIRIQAKWNSLTKRPHAPISFRDFAEVVKESESNLSRSELRQIFNRIDENNNNQISYEKFTGWYSQRQVEKIEEAREAEVAEQEAKLQEYQEKQIKGVGSAPRTVVVRNKTRPLEEHDGYVHIQDAIELQEDGKFIAAIKKYDIGISVLEVQLLQIDRGLEKRKWREKLDEFRHKRARCQREVAHEKRKKQLAQRDKARQKHAKARKRDEDKKLQKEIQAAFQDAAGPETGGRASDDLNGMLEEKKSSDESSSSESEDETTRPPARPTRRNVASESSKKKPKEKKLTAQEQEIHDRIAGHVVDDALNVSFKDVMGLQNVKLALYESIILPNLRPDLFKNITKPTTGLLLFGPPGNGKTMIAKCVASECDATFFSISAAAITSKWVGEAERIMRTLFQIARQRQPSIIFIDEIDSMLTARGGANEHESSRRIKTEFLIQFDGVHDSTEAAANVVVIGATNLPHQLDDAVLRRFPKRIMVPNPDDDARFGLIRLLMSKHRHELHTPDFRALSTDTQGYSCSDLSMMCQDVVMGPLRELRGDVVSAAASDIPPIGRRHFAQSIQNIRASTPAASLRMYDEWNEQYGSTLFLTVDVLPENMRSMIITSEDEAEAEAEADGDEIDFEDDDESKDDDGVSEVAVAVPDDPPSRRRRRDRSSTGKGTQVPSTTKRRSDVHVRRRSGGSGKRSSTRQNRRTE